MLYLLWYSTDFRNLCLSTKILLAGSWVESFRRADMVLLQWQGENFAHVQHLKFPNLKLYTVPAKILYLQRHSTDFRNLCHSSKILRACIWVESFKRAGMVLLQWQGENFAHVQQLKFPTFNLYREISNVVHAQRFSPCNCKSEIPARLKLSTKMHALKIFELWQRFRKSVECLRRYRTFADIVYRLKVEKFQMLSRRKVFTLPLQK